MKKWAVTYSINETFYTEKVNIPSCFGYIESAHMAMDKVKEFNPNAKNMYAVQED